jgi:hypothetical protein
MSPASTPGTGTVVVAGDMSALSGKLLFERSCLPAPDQLDLHVDGAQFLAIVRAGSEAAGV